MEGTRSTIEMVDERETRSTALIKRFNALQSHAEEEDKESIRARFKAGFSSELLRQAQSSTSITIGGQSEVLGATSFMSSSAARMFWYGRFIMVVVVVVVVVVV
jgi:hypothetical protein